MFLVEKHQTWMVLPCSSCQFTRHLLKCALYSLTEMAKRSRSHRASMANLQGDGTKGPKGAKRRKLEEAGSDEDKENVCVNLGSSSRRANLQCIRKFQFLRLSPWSKKSFWVMYREFRQCSGILAERIVYHHNPTICRPSAHLTSSTRHFWTISPSMQVTAQTLTGRWSWYHQWFASIESPGCFDVKNGSILLKTSSASNDYMSTQCPRSRIL